MCAVLPFDERAEVRERGDGHINGREMSRRVQSFERGAAERGELLLVDDVETRQTVLGAARELNIEDERFEQFVLEQRCDERRRALDALMNREQHGVHSLQKLRGPAVRAEQYLALRPADALTLHVYVNHELIAGAADEKRYSLDHQRQIRRVPSALAEKEILLFLEAEQRQRLELPVGCLAKDDGVVRLDVAELGREREDGHHVVAVVGAARRDDAQILVIDIVEQDV